MSEQELLIVLLHKLYWHLLTPSDRQLGDAAGVWSVQGPALDAAYLRQWAATLGVNHLLDDIFAGHIRPKTS
jgi:hypothetical protein